MSFRFFLLPRVSHHPIPKGYVCCGYCCCCIIVVASALSFMQACGKFQRSAVILITKNISSLCTPCSLLLFLLLFGCSLLWLLFTFFLLLLLYLLLYLLLHFMTFPLLLLAKQNFSNIPASEFFFCFFLHPLAWISQPSCHPASPPLILPLSYPFLCTSAHGCSVCTCMGVLYVCWLSQLVGLIFKSHKTVNWCRMASGKW